MISRYSRAEMLKLWSQESKFSCLLEVEKAVAKAQAKQGVIPAAAARAIQQKAKFKVARIEELEQTTKHDVIAFVSNLAESVGDHGKFVHYGLTSSDVLDTALSLQVRAASLVLLKSLGKFESALEKQVKKHKFTLCSGRTHGMHAEPTSFGYKLAGFLAEFKRNQNRFQKATQSFQKIKLSGAVGTYSTSSENIEVEVGKLLKLTPETLATQVIPRDRHAELLSSLAFLASGLERLAIELRHLQRTEVNELEEGFTSGQKGSSAMPHKKNPISAENLTGLSRLMRSYVMPAFENIALWHERDISHSSVERVILPDAFILCDYAFDRAATLLSNLKVKPEEMKANMNISQGKLFASQVLLLLIQKGLAREEAYKIVQSISHSLQKNEHLRTKLLKDKEAKKYLNQKDLSGVFSGQVLKKNFERGIQKVLKYKGEM